MTMTAKQVRQALTRLRKVRASRSTAAVLRTIRVDADGLHATDMDAWLSIYAETGIASPVQVDPVQLAAALKGLKASDVVSFDPVPGSFRVRVNGVELAGVDPADWPDMPSVDAEPVPMPDGVFDAMLDVARAAASGDDSRPVLTGVRVERQRDSVSIVATDSYRLARVLLHGGEVLPDGFGVTLPAKCGKYFEAIGSASMVASGSVFTRLDGADASMLLRVIPGNYPNADQLIPESWEVVGATDSLLEPVERVASVAGRSGVPLELEVENGELIVLWATDDAMVDPVRVSGGWTGEDMTVGFNPGFLRDGLRFVGEREAVRMITPLRPILLGDKYDRCYLVMPVRITTPARKRMRDQVAAAAV